VIEQEFFSRIEVARWLGIALTTLDKYRLQYEIFEPATLGSLKRWSRMQMDYMRDVFHGDLTDAKAVAEWKRHRRARSTKQVQRRTRKETA